MSIDGHPESGPRADGTPDPAEDDAGISSTLLLANTLVFASSTCVMVLEIVAARLIAANLGASLYTWTSVIGVILAGISIGNFSGGKSWLCARHPRKRYQRTRLAISRWSGSSVTTCNSYHTHRNPGPMAGL